MLRNFFLLRPTAPVWGEADMIGWMLRMYAHWKSFSGLKRGPIITFIIVLGSKNPKYPLWNSVCCETSCDGRPLRFEVKQTWFFNLLRMYAPCKSLSGSKRGPKMIFSIVLESKNSKNPLWNSVCCDTFCYGRPLRLELKQTWLVYCYGCMHTETSFQAQNVDQNRTWTWTEIHKVYFEFLDSRTIINVILGQTLLY